MSPNSVSPDVWVWILGTLTGFFATLLLFLLMTAWCCVYHPCDAECYERRVRAGSSGDLTDSTRNSRTCDQTKKVDPQNSMGVQVSQTEEKLHTEHSLTSSSTNIIAVSRGSGANGAAMEDHNSIVVRVPSSSRTVTPLSSRFPSPRSTRSPSAQGERPKHASTPPPPPPLRTTTPRGHASVENRSTRSSPLTQGLSESRAVRHEPFINPFVTRPSPVAPPTTATAPVARTADATVSAESTQRGHPRPMLTTTSSSPAVAHAPAQGKARALVQSATVSNAAIPSPVTAISSVVRSVPIETKSSGGGGAALRADREGHPIVEPEHLVGKPLTSANPPFTTSTTTTAAATVSVATPVNHAVPTLSELSINAGAAGAPPSSKPSAVFTPTSLLSPSAFTSKPATPVGTGDRRRSERKVTVVAPLPDMTGTILEEMEGDDLVVASSTTRRITVPALSGRSPRSPGGNNHISAATVTNNDSSLLLEEISAIDAPGDAEPPSPPVVHLDVRPRPPTPPIYHHHHRDHRSALHSGAVAVAAALRGPAFTGDATPTRADTSSLSRNHYHVLSSDTISHPTSPSGTLTPGHSRIGEMTNSNTDSITASQLVSDVSDRNAVVTESMSPTRPPPPPHLHTPPPSSSIQPSQPPIIPSNPSVAAAVLQRTGLHHSRSAQHPSQPRDGTQTYIGSGSAPAPARPLFPESLAHYIAESGSSTSSGSVQRYMPHEQLTVSKRGGSGSSSDESNGNSHSYTHSGAGGQQAAPQRRDSLYTPPTGAPPPRMSPSFSDQPPSEPSPRRSRPGSIVSWFDQTGHRRPLEVVEASLAPGRGGGGVVPASSAAGPAVYNALESPTRSILRKDLDERDVVPVHPPLSASTAATARMPRSSGGGGAGQAMGTSNYYVFQQPSSYTPTKPGAANEVDDDSDRDSSGNGADSTPVVFTSSRHSSVRPPSVMLRDAERTDAPRQVSATPLRPATITPRGCVTPLIPTSAGASVVRGGSPRHASAGGTPVVSSAGVAARSQRGSGGSGPSPSVHSVFFHPPPTQPSRDGGSDTSRPGHVLVSSGGGGGRLPLVRNGCGGAGGAAPAQASNAAAQPRRAPSPYSPMVMLNVANAARLSCAQRLHQR